MWWEVVTELAYKMAVDCGQAHDFFDMVDELSKHTVSQQKANTQSAMSTLLGQDWRTHRKRGREPIRRISQFNGLLEEKIDIPKEDHPESVLVKRSKESKKEPDMLAILKRTPEDISDRQSMSQKSSISPFRNMQKSTPVTPVIQGSATASHLTSIKALLPQRKSAIGVPKSVSKTEANTSLPVRAQSPATKQEIAHLSDSSLDDYTHLRQQARTTNERKTFKSSVGRPGKPGMAEKKQKQKKRRSSTKTATKEYVVNRLKSVKANENGELVYLVEWQGDWDDTWEPYHFVAHLEDDIDHVYEKASPEIQAAMRMAGHIELVD